MNKISHTRKSFILLCFISFTTAVFSQQHYTVYDNAPGIIKSYKPYYSNKFPAWAKMLYQEPINFKVIDSLFTKDEGNGIEEKEENETAIKRYYILWRKAIQPFVKPDGSIDTMKLKEASQKKTKSNIKNQPQPNALGNWSFAGPKETRWEYDGTNIPIHWECPWQVNVYSFDVAPSNNNILYAGTETGCLNKTTDKAQHWSLMAPDYYFGGAITAVAIHPTNPDIVYVAAGNQVHKSTDGGNTFTSLLTGGISFYADQLKIDKNNPSKLYAVASNGFYTSTDAGTTWTEKWPDASWDVEIKPDNSNIIYVLTTRKVNDTDVYKIYISKNGGATFSEDARFNFNDKVFAGGLLTVTPANPDYIYASLLIDPQPKIYRGNYNDTTGKIKWNLKAIGGTSNLPINNGQGYFDLVLEASPSDANTLFFGTTTLGKSTDGGKNFIAVGGYSGDIPIHPDDQDMKLVSPTETWISTDGGFTFSTDVLSTPENAFARNDGLIGSDFWGVDQGWNENLMVGGRYHNGNTAIGQYYEDKALRLGGAESPTGFIMPGKERYAAFDDLGGGHILPPSLTAPEEGRFSFTKFPNTYYYGYRRSNFLVHPNYYNTYFVGNGNGIWKSIDGGASYTLLHDFGAEVRWMQLSRTNPNVMYADIVSSGLYRTADGGNTWVAKPSLTTTYGWSDWPGNLFFVVSPFNENVLYACAQSAGTGSTRKIFRSADGGDTWQDWTTAQLDNHGTKCLAIQPLPGNKDGVYLFTNYSYSGTVGGKVFFRSEDMSDWVDYSNNYPANLQEDFAMALPFYRDGKLRAAGNMGVWETPLYEPNFPVSAINPMVDKNQSSSCARDTFYFDDYSIVNHAGASWSWSFNPAPQYISDAHSRNPKVVFGNTGNYSVTESITQNGNTYSRTIDSMVSIKNSLCNTIDTVPIAAASFTGSEYAQAPPLNITTNNLTISFWVKPQPNQSDWSGLVLSIPEPKIGLNVLSTMELRYTWNDNYWWNETGLFLVPDKWNHVAMVIEPTKTTIYLNGVSKVIHAKNDSVTLSTPFNIGWDDNSSSRYFKGLIDELCFYNRPLSRNEIREQMHLIKNPATDSSLLHYYQFNEDSGNICYDKAGVNHIQMGNTTYTSSTAPFGSGASKRLNVSAPGDYNFGKAGLVLSFPQGTQPNGDLVVTRINQHSSNSSSADTNLLFGKYWIVNNYGTDTTFTQLTSMKFKDCGAVTADEVANPQQIKLYKRGSFDDLSTDWLFTDSATEVVSKNNSSNISFTSPNVTSFSQFELQRSNIVLAIQSIALHAELLPKNLISINWQTFGESEINKYILQRSTNGLLFKDVTNQQPFNTAAAHAYNYIDANAGTGKIFYRVEVLHKNGAITYSSMVNLSVNEQFSLFAISPNPLQHGQLLHIRVTINEPYELHLFNTEGKEMHISKHSGNATIQLPQLATGTYFYRIIFSNKLINGKLMIE